MKKNLNIIVSDNILKISAGSSLFVLLIVTLLIGLFYQSLPPYIPFFNSLPWGTERLFTSSVVLVLPLFLLAIIVINNMVGASLYNNHSLIARLLSFNALLFVILGFLAYIQIILLVL